MFGKMQEHLRSTLTEIREAGLYKEERIIESPQKAAISVKGKEVLNFCANNYLGLSDHPRLIEGAKRMMDRRGFGMSSVRIISDALNHASIIDGVRLCKAKRYRYANADMADLERCLQEAQAQRFRIICTDGVFSMDGNVAPMDQICDLAEKYDALVMVDESHSAGVVGATGHGVSELCKTYGRVDIYTGTLGKSFGGALGGFTTGRKEIIDMLRQRSRPYLFSNSLAPCIIGASLEVFKMLKESNEIHDRLVENVNYFRDKMMAAGFDIKPTQSAICAVMLYDAKLSQIYANKLLDEGIYVTGFYYPVVPKGQARIRVQISAGHNREQLDRCIEAFVKIGRELGVLK